LSGARSWWDWYEVSGLSPWSTAHSWNGSPARCDRHTLNAVIATGTSVFDTVVSRAYLLL